MNEFVIIGDTKEYEGCLVCLGGTSFERATEILHQMLINPTENDKKLMDGYTNFRIKEVAEKDCWWNYGCD